jgi:LacI family transcriptional regulator
MSRGSGPATMRDVARSAGVSLKTVSRVVNGETTVAPDLAARVRAAVDSLSYRPHIGASMLRRNDRRTRTIAVLLQDVADPFSAAVHRAVEDEARRHGVHVLTGSLDEDPQRERDLARAFAQRQADGLIVAPTGSGQGYLGSLGDLPIVFVDRPAEGFAADSVLATNAAGAAGAVRHLIAHGHRRIAYLGSAITYGSAPSAAVMRATWRRSARPVWSRSTCTTCTTRHRPTTRPRLS